MKKKFLLAMWLTVLLASSAFLTGFIRLDPLRNRTSVKSTNSALASDTTVGQQIGNVAPSPRGNEPTNYPGYLFDRSPAGNGFLFAKSDVATNHSRVAAGDALWLQDEAGGQRFVAKGVVSAKFSPDGRKIAYATDGSELFVETVGGENLAYVPRAVDPNWRSDSAAVSFLALPALDYPDIASHHLVYDLGTGQIVQDSTNR